MAVYKIFPEKDATLYERYPSMNTGLDQILEASSYYSLGDRYNSRYLIQFSTTEIQNVLNNTVTGTWDAYLKNYSATTSGLNTDTELYFYTVSGSWNMGTGRYLDSPQVDNGCSWNFRTTSGSGAWESAGGDVYASPVYSQSFAYSNPIDVNVQVTDTIHDWYSASVPNDGFLVRLTSSIEDSNNLNIQPIFKNFSIDTNTIYPPYLEIKFDDYSFNTGSSSNTILDNFESFISIYNNAGEYYPQSITRFRLAAIPKYPNRQFITASYYTENYYLPEASSSYAIKDSSTNEFIVDFDSTYTRISADSVSSYFDVYMNGLEPERQYTVLIKSIIGGVTKVWDEDLMFKVING
jgi:hypothetical protein